MTAAPGHHPAGEFSKDALRAAELWSRRIIDCGLKLEQAYARFLAHGNPADRDAALVWMDRQNQAIFARDFLIGGERHAAFEERLAQGCDYFNSRYAVALGRGLAA